MSRRTYITAIELYKTKSIDIKKDYHNGLKRDELTKKYNCSHNTLMTVISMLGFPVAESFQRMAKKQLDRIDEQKRLRALPLDDEEEL